jgi:hypothetical protein
MGIRAKITNVETISTSLSDVNSIRLSAPSINIKPELSINELIDASSVDAETDDILLFTAVNKKFIPIQSSEVIPLPLVNGGSF